MKIGRFRKDNINFFGAIVDGNVIPIKQQRLYEIMECIDMTDVSYDISSVKFLPPTRVTKIVAIGLNYKAHADEMNKKIPCEPLIFLKPSTSVISNKMKIIFPKASERVDYEGELAVVIGKRCKDVSRDQAKNYILGYSCFNDVTARDLQRKDVQYTRAKSFDTFAPYGPWIETEMDPHDTTIITKVNGEIKQKGFTSDMIFDVYELVSFVSKIMTLLPGDIIATGTPPGVGPLKVGDKVEVEIEGIGTLINYVVKED